MKSKLVGLICMLAACFTPLRAEPTILQQTRFKTGTGAHDLYNLGVTLGDKPAAFYVAIASNKKISLDDVTATVAGEAMGLSEKQTYTNEKTAIIVDSLVIDLSRAQMERGAVDGMKIVLKSKRGGLEFTIPASNFVQMLHDADEKDPYRIRVKAEEAAEKARAAGETKLKAIADNLAASADAGREAAVKYAQKGTGKLTGQAFLKTEGGDVKIGAGNFVTLIPAVPWFLAAADLGELYSPKKWPAAVSDIYKAGPIRMTQADASGNFEFSDLPAGEYQLITTIEWQVPGTYGSRTTGGRVTRRVEVPEGGAVKVMLTR